MYVGKQQGKNEVVGIYARMFAVGSGYSGWECLTILRGSGLCVYKCPALVNNSDAGAEVACTSSIVYKTSRYVYKFRIKVVWKISHKNV